MKNLEENLNKILLLRQGNLIVSTDAGEEIYPKFVRAFDELSDAVNIIRNIRQVPQLVISVLPSLTELWLLPKVVKF